MDIERAFISKVVEARAFPRVVELGVTIDHLLDERHRDAWTLLLRHFTTHSRSMGADAFAQNLPSYKLLDVPEPIEWYVEQVKSARVSTIAKEMVADLIDAAEADDVPEIIRITSVGLRSISTETAVLSDHDVTQLWDKRLSTYEDWHKSGSTMRGIPTGYRSVDTTTRGLQPGNMVVIVGLPGTGKTTLALSICKNVHEEQYKVLVVSFEMLYEELASRYDAMRAGIDHHRLTGGRLSKQDMRRLQHVMKEDQDNESFIISEDISQMTTVSALQAKVQQHRPDVMLVDGAYMMQDENGEPMGSPAAQTNVSRGLSMMSKVERIPLLVTTQALESKTRGGRVRLGSIGYTSAWSQDASVVLGLNNDPDDKEQSLLDTVKSRNGPLAEAVLDWNWREARFDEISSDLDDVDDEES